MELTTEYGPGSGVVFTAPQPAFDDGRYAMSPYLHYYEEVRRRREGKEPLPAPPSDDGDEASRFEELLRQLIKETLA